MSGSRDPESSLSAELIAEAASWCARNDRPSTSVENDPEFRGWLADDPRRRAAFDAVSRTLMDPALITALREVDQVSSRPIAARKFGSMPFRTWVAAGVLLICVAWLTRPMLDLALAPQTTVVTAPGQTRSVTLSDGSRVEVSGGTSLQIRLASTRRKVRMEQGEAFFTVAPDAKRPFIVEAVDGRVEVRGTAFDLSQTRDGLELAVHHGRVAFGRAGFLARTIDLVAGERAEVSGGVLSQVKHFNSEAGDWRTGWLETDGVTLAGLAERLARQHNVVVSVDPSLGDKRIAGRFRLNNPEALLRRLSALHGFAVTRMDAGLMIGPRPSET